MFLGLVVLLVAPVVVVLSEEHKIFYAVFLTILGIIIMICSRLKEIEVLKIANILVLELGNTGLKLEKRIQALEKKVEQIEGELAEMKKTSKITDSG